MAIDIAQGMIDQAFTQGYEADQANTPQAPLPDPQQAQQTQGKGFSEEYFKASPESILEDLGPTPGDDQRRSYRFAGDGKVYNAKADKPLDKVLEGIWDHNSPGLWGSAKAQTLYGLPADLSSAIAYGLGGLGLDEMSEDWRSYSDDLRKEYNQKYGQFMVPGFSEALDKGKVWDYAMQNIGFGAPYMGMALAGGLAGGLAAGAVGAGEGTVAMGVGQFLGSTAITSPATIAQFADRQVAEMRAKGIENPEDSIDWIRAAGLGTLASGLQALPVESILMGGPVLGALTKWGVKTGTPASARMLASMADVAGTNALAGAGTSYLSRLNADMPLLDDAAKQEYLEGAIVGSLVGIPFGIYRGMHPLPHGVEVKDKPLADIIKENEAPRDAETTVPQPGETTESPLALSPPRNSILHDPNYDYGIKSADEAAEYLDKIKYNKDGQERNGLDDFVKKHGLGYSDADIVDAARRVARINDQQNYLRKTKDGVLYPTIDTLPQEHSNDPKVLTKAAALADRYGYEDSFVKSLPDITIEKLFDLNLKRELEKTQSKLHKDVFDQVLQKSKDLVDEQVQKDVQQYGSLYNRPDVIKRTALSVEQRRALINKNPRAELAKMLLTQKREPDKMPGRSPDDVQTTPGWVKPKDQQKFEDQFVNVPKQLTYTKPIVDAIDKGANTPGPRVNEKLSKKEFNDFLLNSPLMKALMGKDKYDLKEIKTRLENGRRELKYPSKPKEKPSNEEKVFSSGKFSGVKPQGKNVKSKDLPLDRTESDYLGALRDRLYKASQERNKDFLKEHPEFGPALNDMFKRFSELSGVTEITKNPQTRAFKGRTGTGLMEGLENRARVSKALENAFQYIDKAIGTRFANVFDNILAGKEVTPYSAANVITLMDTAFHLGDYEQLKNIDVNAIESIYKDIRQSLPDNTKKTLENSRPFLENWYKAAKDVNVKDIKGFKLEDLEALAYADYVRGDFNPNFKLFKDSKQYKVFNSIDTALKRLRKELNDQGYKKVEDMVEYNKDSVERVPPEAQRPSVFHRRVVQEVMDQEAAKTTEANVKSMQEAKDDQNFSIPKNAFKAPPPEHKGQKLEGPLKDLGNNVGPGWHYSSYLRSIPSLARQVPIFSKVYNNLFRQHTLASEYQARFANKFSKVWDDVGGWQPMLDAHKVLDHLRISDQKIVKDVSGRLKFIGEDGQEKLLDHNMTKAVDYVTDLYKEPYRAKDEIVRGFLGKYFKEEGLAPDSSLKHIKRVIDHFDEKIKGNPLPEAAAKFRLQKEALEQLHYKLVETDEIIKNDNPYVPYMRFGDYVVDVIDRQTGKQLFMTSINEQNKFGSKAANPSENQIRQKINELGLNAKFADPNKYEIRSYQLTHNKIGEYINKGLVSTELIQSLMSSGIDNHLKVADHFATGIEDPKQFFNDFTQDIAQNKYRILRYVAARGAGRFGMKSQNIPGYSKEWDRVLDTFMNIHANSLAKQAKMQEWGEIQAELIKGEMPQHLRERINKYIDFMNDPGNDWSGIRTFNFVYAMGAAPSSALLQLNTLLQQTPALALAYSPNILRNIPELSAAIRRTIPHVVSMGRTKLLPETQNFVDSQPGFFRASLMQDVLKQKIPGQDAISRKLPHGSTVQSAAQGVVNAVKKIPGMFITPAERMTRISTWDFYHNMFKNRPDTLQRAIKYREKDHNWQEFYNNHKDVMNLEQAMASYSMLETHGVYGKHGRSDIQRGFVGAMALPFTTYAQQMMEVLGSQLTMQQGLPGLYAGLWTMGTYVTLAGLSGVPGYELWKTLYEQYQSKVNNRLTDAEMEMKETGVPDWLRKGLMSTSSGLDISSRIGQELIAQNILEGIVKGEFKLSEVGGLPGKTFQGLMDGAADLGNDLTPGSTMEKLGRLAIKIAPKAAQDVFKAYDLAENPESVLKTATGKMLRDPSGVDSGDILARATGFSTLEDTETRQRIFWQQRANQEFNQAKSRLSEGVATARYKMALGARQNDPELYQEGMDMLKDMQRNLLGYAKTNKLVLDNRFWSGFNRSVQDRLWQKLNPGKIRKPTEGEIRHISSLIDDGQQE